MKKLFKNRITQEDEKTINKLKSTYIEMNYDKETTSNTPDGLFFITFNPNNEVDEVKLQNDFEFILKLYYHWKYGGRWFKKKHLQYQYEGILEQQHYKNHIHFNLDDKNMNMEELAIFLGYIKAIFKQLYIKASFKFQRVYDIDGLYEYLDINNEGTKQKERTAPPIYITNIQR